MTESTKHTIAGILTGLIGTLTTITAFQVPAAMLNPQASQIWLYITVGCNLAAIILRVWVGVITQGAATILVSGSSNVTLSPGTIDVSHSSPGQTVIVPAAPAKETV